jgi:S1-C subfamily serine protease
MPERIQYSRLVFLNGLLMLTVIGLSIALAWETKAVRSLLDRQSAEQGFASDAPKQTRLAATPTPAGFSRSQRKIAEDETATIALFKSSAPSVVHITTHSVARDFFSLNVHKIPRGSGTGFVWDNLGHIVTNFHVVDGADIAYVSFGDRDDSPARLVGAAPEKDLAVLKIDIDPARLRPLPLGTSSDLEVGLKALAIGNPFGLDHTLTTGIISALGREIESSTGLPIKDVIQTDAAINPGNSGGPLLDSSGKLIGVHTAIFSPSGTYAGIGFAIPVDVVKWVVPELIKHGKVIR